MAKKLHVELSPVSYFWDRTSASIHAAFCFLYLDHHHIHTCVTCNGVLTWWWFGFRRHQPTNTASYTQHRLMCVVHVCRRTHQSSAGCNSSIDVINHHPSPSSWFRPLFNTTVLSLYLLWSENYETLLSAACMRMFSEPSIVALDYWMDGACWSFLMVDDLQENGWSSC